MKYQIFSYGLILTLLLTVSIVSLSTPCHAGMNSFDPFDSSQLTNYSTETLIDFLTLDYINWHWEQVNEEEIDLIIVSELIRRREASKLLNAFEHPQDDFQQERVMYALYEIQDPLIYKMFKKHATSDTTKTMYLCVNYLAKKGDRNALSILNDNYWQYPVSSWQWSYTVKLFGKYKYKPVALNLIRSLDAASLNLVEASIESLEELFPGDHPEFKSLQEAKDYFRNKWYNSKDKWEDIQPPEEK